MADVCLELFYLIIYGLVTVPLPEYSVRSWFYQWYQWYTNIVQGSTNGTIGNDRWLPIVQTIYSVGKITNA